MATAPNIATKLVADCLMDGEWHPQPDVIWKVIPRIPPVLALEADHYAGYERVKPVPQSYRARQGAKRMVSKSLTQMIRDKTVEAKVDDDGQTLLRLAQRRYWMKSPNQNQNQNPEET